MVALNGYWWFVALVRSVLLFAGAVVAILCAVDWSARTRRLNPFGPVARFCRVNIDPLMAPVERMLVRAGGRPSLTPWWSLFALVVAAILVMTLLELGGDIVRQLSMAAASPQILPKLLLSWAFSLLKLALLVRVIASWITISPRSAWIRWSYVLTEWMLAPLRRFVPLVGSIDLTPLVAWLLLSLVERLLGIG